MDKKPYKLKITKSNNPKKKFTAIFFNKEGKKIKTQHFGAAGMSDFTIHKDEERKQRYINRHKKRENFFDPMTAGSLAVHILWNKTTLRESIKDFKQKFNLK